MIRFALSCFLALAVGLGLLTGCGDDPSVLDDLSDTSYDLVAHDGSPVTFPDAYDGQILLVGYVYTQCPDVCSMITANMKTVRDRLDSTEGVTFVTISFDPRRDTPERLTAFRDAFRIEAGWPFLTGDSTTVARLMDRLDVRRRIVTHDGRPASPDTLDSYFIDHTDQVTLVDAEGRVRFHYSGSRTPPEILIEDITKLQS